MTIGQLARSAGVGIETVRFYERRGLLEEPPRKASGYRQYGDDVVARLRFIRRAKELGFSLKEIGELTNLRFEPASTCAEMKQKTQAKVADIDSKICDLKRMRKTLLKLATTCKGDGPIHACPILDALDTNDPHEET
jgi:MerR family mercuric resistance operon transcriptional regulator